MAMPEKSHFFSELSFRMNHLVQPVQIQASEVFSCFFPGFSSFFRCQLLSSFLFSQFINSHEKAVQEMFHLNDNRLRKIGGARKLEAGVPMVFYVLDVGGGFVDDLEDENQVGFEEIRSTPLRAVLEGLRHPDIRWGEFTHFDWASYDKAVMAGGIVKPESAMFASHQITPQHRARTTASRL